MKRQFPIIVALCAFLSTALTGFSQSISNFAGARLQVSGGDANVVDTRCSIFGGWLSVDTSGAITGAIIRRSFPNGQSNSGSVSLNVSTGSRVFGPVVNEGSITNTSTWGTPGESSGMETRISTYYGADFFIGTQNPSFFVKGRARHEVGASTTISTNIFPQPDPQNPEQTIVVTNVYTNTYNWENLGLGGVSFGGTGAQSIRGVFNANEVSY